jgi:hypothetical protein
MSTTTKKRMSPFSKEFWMAKGYNEVDADYKRNSIRPIKPEYWLERGFSSEDAIAKAKEAKASNDKKATEASKAIPIEKRRENSNVCVEYWLKRGYTKEEAKAHIAERQNTFSLEKCIEKYGMAEGLTRWQDRQKRWQNTLNSKSKEEKDSINLSKSVTRFERFNDIDHCIHELARVRGMYLTKDLTEFKTLINNKIEEKPFIKFMLPQKYIKSVPKVQIQILLEVLDITETQLITEISDLFYPIKYFIDKGKRWHHNLHTEDGLLRSSFEIHFYETFKKLFPNEPIQIDKMYPNSRFRYDFCVFGDYIEICPMYEEKGKELYTQKMEKKKKLFNCIFLRSINEIDSYLKEKSYENIGR